MHEQITVGDGGRIVIPAAFREALHIKPKDKLTIRFDDGELRISSKSLLRNRHRKKH